MRIRNAIFALGALAFAFAAAAAHAQSVEEFYRGRVVTLYIGFSPGGGYDVYGRLVARHIGRFIPGQPTVIPVNMEGAGSIRLANWLYNAAPKDGTALGTVNRGVPFEPLVGNADLAQFDATKFTWIGSANDETSVCASWERTGITSFEQLYNEELIVGATGPGADDYVFAKVVANVLGAKLRLVTGYSGGNNVDFAIERGEVDGRCGWSWSSVKSTKAQWLRDGLVNIFLQVGLQKNPELAGVPWIMDLVETEEERQILRLVLVRGVLGRPYMAPPGIPADRALALQQAFDAMVADAEFLADAARSRLDIVPISGPEIARLMAETYATPPALVAQARDYVR